MQGNIKLRCNIGYDCRPTYNIVVPKAFFSPYNGVKNIINGS